MNAKHLQMMEDEDVQRKVQRKDVQRKEVQRKDVQRKRTTK
jgi:hypothetical protein